MSVSVLVSFRDGREDTNGLSLPCLSVMVPENDTKSTFMQRFQGRHEACNVRQQSVDFVHVVHPARRQGLPAIVGQHGWQPLLDQKMVITATTQLGGGDACVGKMIKAFFLLLLE